MEQNYWYYCTSGGIFLAGKNNIQNFLGSLAPNKKQY